MASILRVTASPAIDVLLAAVVSTSLLFAGIYLFTTLKFQYDFYHAQHDKQSGAFKPPQLPYSIPWLGNSMSFLVWEPQKFWKQLFSWYPRSLGACSIVLGGKPTTIFFNRYAAQYLMRDRDLTRDSFNVDVVVQGLGVTKEECEAYYEYHGPPRDGKLPAHEEHEKTNLEYLLKSDRVNELTAEFLKTFQLACADQYADGPEEINLYEWARNLMFRASTTALMGSKILEVCTDFEAQFFQFDQDMLGMFFGLPKIMIPKAYNNRDEAVKSLMEWHDVVMKESGNQITDPDAVAWEPLYGSRINRKRQQYYRKAGLSKKCWAQLDLGMMFGIASNAIPAVGWMLIHILDSARPENKVEGERTLFEHIMGEVKTARRGDGSIDVPTLVNLPVLSSTLHEVLRVYVDVLISRLLHKDVTLPLGDPKDANARKVDMKKGSIIMAPSWPAHYDAVAWQSQFPHHPPPDQFYPYRFLTSHPDDDSQKSTFTTSHATGMFFPFGGGKTICPGRTFAKQEILAGVAILLTEFDIEPIGFVDVKGRATETFPGLRDSLPGSSVMVASGDMKIRIRKQL